MPSRSPNPSVGAISTCFLWSTSDIPFLRQETAVLVTHLVHLLLSNVHTLPPELRVLDLCTGSGCIPLLFNHEFYSRLSDINQPQDVELNVAGVDLSSPAIRLSQENQQIQLGHLKRNRSTQSRQYKTLEAMSFLQADVLQHDQETSSSCPSVAAALRHHWNFRAEVKCDILISNPPYISSTAYYRTTSPSVRNYEPKSALVPPAVTAGRKNSSDGDLFYHHILQHARQLDTQIVLVEVADLEQAKRVAALMIEQGIWDGVKIWRDDPNARCETQSALVPLQHHGESRSVPVLGSGNGRSVLAFRGRGTQWLGKLECNIFAKPCEIT